MTSDAEADGPPDRPRPYPQGPPGTKPSPSDKFFQDLTYSRAKNAFLLGVASVLCCGFVTGIPAIWVGLRAIRDIDASGGLLRGRGTAKVAIVLGVIGSLVFVGADSYQAAHR